MFFFSFLKSFFLLIPILLSVAFLTLFERKLLSIVGFRIGPNKVSFLGVLQPIADALKLSNKQVNYLTNFFVSFFYLGSFLMFLSTFMIWGCVYTEPVSFSLKFSCLSLMLILGFFSLFSILAGWSSFSKYSLIGSVRTVSQMVSYEAVLYFCFFFFFFFFFSFNFFSFNFFFGFFFWFFFPLLLYFWIPSMLADLNRTPFDFSEGESELVSGFNTEFGSLPFTFLFLSEYGNILFFCSLSSFLFFFPLFFLFFLVFFFFVVWIRSVLPRFRFDKLMILSWKFFIPCSTVLFLYYFICIF